MPKQYGAASSYEQKLERVMQRINIKEFSFNWDRFTAWVEFKYKGQLYRFEHSLEKAKAHGVELKYGSDAFAQIVLALEDLARMVERGIYDLQTWVSGMKYLPAAAEVLSFFKVLGFDKNPTSKEEVKDKYKSLSKQLHPDAGGKAEDFIIIKQAYDSSMKYLETGD